MGTGQFGIHCQRRAEVDTVTTHAQVQAKGRHLASPLNRPEYIPVPEALLTALAWQEFGISGEPWAADEKPAVGMIYRRLAKAKKTVRFVETCPSSEEQIARLGRALLNSGLEHDDDQRDLAIAVAQGLAGLRAPKATGVAATPFSAGTALLQDLRGMTGKASPAAAAANLEAMAAMGADSPVDDGWRVSALWRDAAALRVDNDPLIGSLDSAFREYVEWAICVADRVGSPAPALEWGGLFPDSPFAWFRRAWTTLMQPAWVLALPSRLWVDWSLLLLRTVVGVGYLWEAAWYQRVVDVLLGTAVQEPLPATWQDLCDGVPSPLPWLSSANPPSVRSVTGVLRPRVGMAHNAHTLLHDWLDTHPAEADTDALVALAAMSADAKLLRALEDASRPRRGDGDNSWEAIRATLLRRTETAGAADYFGLLRAPASQLLIVDPGIEWMAAMASLACDRPGEDGTLKDVARFLRGSGLVPDGADLLNLLERSGLARGSADADQAVIVRAAFERAPA
jgi:hypothetical protein